MKYFKKFLIVGFFTLFGVSFCNSGSMTYTGHYKGADLYVGSFFAVRPFQGNDISGEIEYECTFSNFSGSFSSSNSNANYYFIVSSIDNGNSVSTSNFGKFNTNVIINNGTFTGKGMYDQSYLRNLVGFGFNLGFRNTSSFSFDYSCTLSGQQFENDNLNCPTCDYSDYLTQEQCNNQYIGYIQQSTVNSGYCLNYNLCPSCSDQYTSLDCQIQYNLIPISSVTENYCTSNFDLISPSDCPISEGSGGTSWSALWLNNVQYAGASNIYINVSDLLDYSTTYIDSGSSFVIDVDGYVADTEYLDNILTIQQYHPDSEDFTSAFVGGLTLLLPYVVVILFVVFVWKLIKKIFKS